MSGQVLVYFGLLALMVVGILGAMIPAIPGPSLVVIAIVIWGLIKGFGPIAAPLTVAIVILVLCTAIDWLGGILGAQKAGAGPWAQWGALIGGLAGVFGLLPALPIGGPIAGLLFGPLLGAFIGEFLDRSRGVKKMPIGPRLRGSCKAAIGIFVGTIVGQLAQAILALVATIVFIVNTWSQAFAA